MPFTTVNLKSGQSVRVEHSEDATDEEIIQLAVEKDAAQAAAPERSGSLARTGVGIASEIAIGEGGKLAGAAAGAAIGSAVPVIGTAVGAAAGYLVGGIASGLSGSYVRQKVSRPGEDLSQGELVADTLLNLVPFAGVGKGAGAVTRTAQHLALGGTTTAGAVAIESVIENGTLPTLEELAKAGLTGGVLSVGFGMSADRFAKSYEKFAGRKVDRFMDAVKKGDPDAVDLATSAEKAAVENIQNRNKELSKKSIILREQLDDELIRLQKEQNQSSGGIFEGKGKLIVDKDVVNKDGSIKTEGNDAYRALTLARKLTDNRIDATRIKVTNITDNIREISSSSGVSADTLVKRLDEYLHAKYAPEFRGTGKNKKPDGAAGVSILGNKMTDENAKAIVNEFEKNMLPISKQLVDDAQDLSKDILRTLEEGGIVTAKKAKALRDQNPNYVPLQRLFDDAVDADDADNFFFSRSVFNPKTLKKAKGDEDLQVSIIKNLVDGNVEAAKLAEANKANLVFKKLLEDPRNKERAGEIVKIKKETASGKGFGKDAPVITVFDPDKSYNIYKIVDGKKQIVGESNKYYLDFSDGAAQELGAAVRGMNKHQVKGVMKLGYGINKWLGAAYTGYNPSYLIPNLMRDRVVSALNTFKNLDSNALLSVANPLSAGKEINVIRKKLFGGKASNPEQQKMMDDYDAFVRDGGSTGGIATSILRDISKNVKDIDFSSNKTLKQRGAALNDFVRKANEMVEDSTRFSVYRAARAAGRSGKDAAIMARNSSFDPMKKGTRGDQLRALYLFSNPSIQSAKNFWRSLKDPKVFKPVLASTLGTAVLLETYNSMIDPDWRNKVKGGADKSDWRLNKHLVVLNPFKGEDGSLSYAQFPLAYEAAPIWTAASGGARMLSNQTMRAAAAAGMLSPEELAAMPGRIETPDKIISSIGQSILDGYNPTGGSLVPTAINKIHEVVWGNKDGLGREIVPDYLMDQNMAAYAKINPWTAKTVGGEIAIELSKELENLGAPVSPERLLHLYESGLGGGGADIMRVFDVISKHYNGEEIKANDVPIFRRFFGSTYADGFEQRTGIEPDLKLFEYEQNTQNSLNSQEAFDIITKLKKIDDPFERQLALQNELSNANKSVQRRVKKMVKDQERGITRSDKMIRKLGVENGNRARFYETQIEKMPPSFINEFLQEQKDKGILTKNVENQIRLKRALESLAPQSIVNEN
jgi:hypothetical protein